MVLGVLPLFAGAKTPSKRSDFSGQWNLDFNQTKNPPAGLTAYSVNVSQDQQQLKVGTSVQGNLRLSGGNGQYPRRGGGYPGGGYPGGMGMPRPIGMGWPRGGRRGSVGPGQSRRLETIAFKLYPASAVYKLDGTPSTAHLGDRDRSDAAAKAEWAKGGKQLKLTLLGQGADRSGQMQFEDRWKLDGQYLKIDRKVHTPNGSTTVHLVFRKEIPEPASATTQSAAKSPPKP